MRSWASSRGASRVVLAQRTAAWQLLERLRQRLERRRSVGSPVFSHS